MYFQVVKLFHILLTPISHSIKSFQAKSINEVKMKPRGTMKIRKVDYFTG